MKNRRRTAGMTTAEWGKVAVGIVIIGLGLTVVKAWPGDTQSPIPGIDFEWGRSVVMIGFVILMFPVIAMYFIKPLKEAIDGRNQALERTFDEVEQLRSEMQTMRNEYEKRLAETEASAREQIQAQIREAQALRQTLMTEAAQRADALLKQAEVTIEQEKQRALLEIRSSVVELTLEAASKVIGENLDDARNRRLIEDFISGVGAAV